MNYIHLLCCSCKSSTTLYAAFLHFPDFLLTLCPCASQTIRTIRSPGRSLQRTLQTLQNISNALSKQSGLPPQTGGTLLKHPAQNLGNTVPRFFLPPGQAVSTPGWSREAFAGEDTAGPTRARRRIPRARSCPRGEQSRHPQGRDTPLQGRFANLHLPKA